MPFSENKNAPSHSIQLFTINMLYCYTQVSFITYDRSVHFYSMPEGASQPTQLTVSDVDDIFLPSPTDLLVNLQENNALVRQLLEALPDMFASSYSTESSLGAALQVCAFLSKRILH